MRRASFISFMIEPIFITIIGALKRSLPLLLFIILSLTISGATPIEKKLQKAAKQYQKGKTEQLNIFTDALFDPDENTRKLALNYLAEFKDAESVVTLHKALDTQNDEFFNSVLRVLLDIRSVSSIHKFISLLGAGNSQKDSILIEALISYGTDVIPMVNDSYLNEYDRLKKQLGKVLLRLKPESISYLYYNLLHQKFEESEHTRLLCIEMGNEMFIYIINELAKYKQELSVTEQHDEELLLKQMIALGLPMAEYILNNLSRIIDNYNGTITAKSDYLDALEFVVINQEQIPVIQIRSCLFYQNPDVQKFAIKSLLTTGGATNEFFIIESLKNPLTSKPARLFILSRITSIKHVSPILIIFSLFAEKDPDIINSSQKALMEIGGKFQNDIELFIDHSDPMIQSIALEVAYHYPSDIYIEAMDASAYSENEIIRLRIAECLARIEDHRSVDILFRLFKDDSPLVTWSAATGLIAKKESARIMLENFLMTDTLNSDKRTMAIYILGEIGNSESIKTMIMSYKNNLSEKQAILSAANKFGTNAVPELKECLALPDTNKQLIALEVCRNNRIKGCAEEIFHLLNSPSFLIRLTAIMTISGICDDNSIDTLVFYADRKDPAEMLSVIEAIDKMASPKGLSFLFDVLNNHLRFYQPYVYKAIKSICDAEDDLNNKANIYFEAGKTLFMIDEWDKSLEYLKTAYELNTNPWYKEYIDQIMNINKEYLYVSKLFDNGYIDNKSYWNYAKLYYRLHSNMNNDTIKYKMAICDSLITDFLSHVIAVDSQNNEILPRLNMIEYTIDKTDIIFIGVIPDSSENATFSKLNLSVGVSNKSNHSVQITPLIFKLTSKDGKAYYPRIQYSHEDLAVKESRFRILQIASGGTDELLLTFILPVSFDEMEYELQILGLNPWQPQIAPVQVFLPSMQVRNPGF